MASPGRRAGGRTRWRRFAVVLVPALAAAAGLVVLTAQSVLAGAVSLFRTPFVGTARGVRGQGFGQVGVLGHSVIDLLSGQGYPIVLTGEWDRTRWGTNSQQEQQARTASQTGEPAAPQWPGPCLLR